MIPGRWGWALPAQSTWTTPTKQDRKQGRQSLGYGLRPPSSIGYGHQSLRPQTAPGGPGGRISSGGVVSPLARAIAEVTAAHGQAVHAAMAVEKALPGILKAGSATNRASVGGSDPWGRRPQTVGVDEQLNVAAEMLRAQLSQLVGQASAVAAACQLFEAKAKASGERPMRQMSRQSFGSRPANPGSRLVTELRIASGQQARPASGISAMGSMASVASRAGGNGGAPADSKAGLDRLLRVREYPASTPPPPPPPPLPPAQPNHAEARAQTHVRNRTPRRIRALHGIRSSRLRLTATAPGPCRRTGRSYWRPGNPRRCWRCSRTSTGTPRRRNGCGSRWLSCSCSRHRPGSPRTPA